MKPRSLSPFCAIDVLDICRKTVLHSGMRVFNRVVACVFALLGSAIGISCPDLRSYLSPSKVCTVTFPISFTGSNNRPITISGHPLSLIFDHEFQNIPNSNVQPLPVTNQAGLSELKQSWGHALYDVNNNLNILDRISIDPAEIIADREVLYAWKFRIMQVIDALNHPAVGIIIHPCNSSSCVVRGSVSISFIGVSWTNHPDDVRAIFDRIGNILNAIQSVRLYNKCDKDVEGRIVVLSSGNGVQNVNYVDFKILANSPWNPANPPHWQKGQTVLVRADYTDSKTRALLKDSDGKDLQNPQTLHLTINNITLGYSVSKTPVISVSCD